MSSATECSVDVGRGDSIQTYTGRRFFPLHAAPSEVDIVDIAHALSQICRWTGHTRSFYSVAQHSILVSQNCDPADSRWGLLHDATEAYMCDLSRPVKHSPELAGYAEIEKRLMSVICAAFGLSPEMPKSVHVADLRMLYTEGRDLLMGGVREWWSPKYKDPTLGYGFTIIPWQPEVAERAFLAWFSELFVNNKEEKRWLSTRH